ncbi:hypothetical protein V5799_032431 [Amblyomma americanum]|uniref:Uncharacterized protein n=1 Tax=Amblyomma americanum TaxID=6943 RepID=A0AAQ4DR71_AMBAM
MQMQHRQGVLKQEQTTSSSPVTDAPSDDGPEQIGPGPESALLPSREVATTADVMKHEKGGGQGVPGVFNDAPIHVTLTDDAEDRKHVLFFGLECGAATIDKDDSAVDQSTAVNAPALPTGSAQSSPRRSSQRTKTTNRMKRVQPESDIAKGKSESQIPGIEHPDVIAPRGVLPPLALRGPVLVKDKRKS